MINKHTIYNQFISSLMSSGYNEEKLENRTNK